MAPWPRCGCRCSPTSACRCSPSSPSRSGAPANWSAPSTTPRELRLALVQPSIPQRLLWDDREATNRFRQLLDLSSLALAAQPHLLVWPEASLPNLSDADYRALIDLIAHHRIWMILGADDAERRPEGGFDAYNSAFLFDPTGHYRTTYRKQRLVIFGEYIPLERWLPFLKHFTPIEGSFTPGPGPVPFVLTNPPVNLSVLICFEDVFARDTRLHVTPDTDFLLNLTNNGWFGESAAQYQHAANAVFRAIENGVPLVRCANNGLTCWIDERGRLRQALGWPDGNIYAPGFLSVRLPLGPPDRARPRPSTGVTAMSSAGPAPPSSPLASSPASAPAAARERRTTRKAEGRMKNANGASRLVVRGPFP
ncbi:MAG: apolipoprotein N-acyltransferase [Verrucomicrobia bacterium]|nr:apolipoprotein N-acyltransferase [Verrucomicrobiota bacterium]